MSRPDIEHAVDFQRRLELGGIHLVYLDESGFTLAHTDYERRTKRSHLHTCEHHRWLESRDEMPVTAKGWYKFDLDADEALTPLWDYCKCGNVLPHIDCP